MVRGIDGGAFEMHMRLSDSNLICGNADLVPEVVEVIKAADAKMWKKVGLVST